ncbi:MAG: tRNA pseudouridine(38-40) synthase TruA [Simkaniaceae bacterium]|nr:tRNA pseudouridine(38-40) synthase TruA [Simkaniaceae bacterium]
MKRYKALIAYDGTQYGGWQVQPNAVTIQAVIQEVLSTILQTPTHLTASGRTDAGVHALGQVAHFLSHKEVTAHALNSLLPPDIRILSLEEVDPSFHARFSARNKEYHYHLHTDSLISPFIRPYRTYHPYSLDLNLIEEAIPLFHGTHNFTSFANCGGSKASPIKTIYRLDMIRQEGGVRFEFEGSGFLYKMVRNIVGTLLEVGAKKRLLSSIPPLFSLQDRREGGKAAPPTGLFLIKVNY